MGSLNLVPASFADYRRLAERRLPRALFDYADGGAVEEVTLRANVADFEALRLRQRVLRDVSNIDTSIDLFGEKLAMPLILAPVGMGGMYARRAEVQAKRAADAAGIPQCLSTLSICSLEEVSRVSGQPPWFQLYMLKDRDVVKAMLERAWDLGVRTLFFTVDLNVVGARYRDVRNGMTGGGGLWGKLRSGVIDYALHPRWLWQVGLSGRPHDFGNVTAYVPNTSLKDYRKWVGQQVDSSVTWKDIEWLRAVWQGTLVLKGILDPEDAKQGIAAGADGLVVSNHGARQLDGVRSTAAMLPRVADATGGAKPLLVDGGIRSGQDLVKALALGASAALIGRPWVFAVAAQGEVGLRRMLGQYRDDMRNALGLTGYPNAADVDGGALDWG